MRKTSEWVSCGHPDKTADYISSCLLDRYIENDPKTRYAVEVQIKDNFVTLGGEITSKCHFNDIEIEGFVRDAVNEVGYTKSYQSKWGVENTICGEDIDVSIHVSKQSDDIAKGVNQNGWGDQGIFWGMAVNSPETDYMPKDWWIARKIGKRLYDIRYAGIDIKTQVTMNCNKIEEIVVAIPMTEKHYDYDITNAVKFCCGGKMDYDFILNGTGRFVKHGPIGDCGTTGRKLAVDFYGGNCRIGGGSPWTKDGTKADLTLNLLARKLALDFIKNNPSYQEVHCAISCRIGSEEIYVSIFDKNITELVSYKERAYPSELISTFRLNEPNFAKMCMNGLFTAEDMYE